MDQLKEFIRQAIKYRFWIALGISALLPMIAYFVGVGPVRKAADDEANKITAADKDVSQYASGTVINAQYKPIVSEKTGVLSTDVRKTWEKLYARQAPLLKWPERVEDRFPKWGRAWPADIDPGQVQIAIIDYVNAYPEEVDKVYKSFNPFDLMEGTGIVAAPPKEQLLRPAQFTIETPPSLGKVWAAQERLWIQGTLLDVIAKVNAGADKWDDAIVRQIDSLEVGNQLAQDQRSIAQGQTLEKAPEITDPNKPVEEAPAEGAIPGMGGGGAVPGMMPGMMGGEGMMGMGGGGMTNNEDVYYIGAGAAAGAEGEEAAAAPAEGTSQFKIMPVMITVLVDQNRIQDFLVALENSPMNIQVMDFEMTKPTTRVTKPEKGVGMNFGMGMGMMGMMGGMPGMSGYGGAMARGMGGGMPGMMPGGEGMMGMGGGMPGMMGGVPGMGGGMPGMGPGMGMGAGMGSSRQGIDKRSENLAKKFEQQVKTARKGVTNSLFDPYYNIVQVTVYGQARFFSRPTEEAAPEASTAETTAAEPGADPAADAAKAEIPAEPGAEPAKAEPAKAETAKTEEPAKAEPAKTEEPAKAEPTKAEEPAKAETPAEPAKTEEPAKG